MVYIVEKSTDYYGDNGCHPIYASTTLENAQAAIITFIENNPNEELYNHGYDKEDNTWWYDTNEGWY